jgi:hypothetical protein
LTRGFAGFFAVWWAYLIDIMRLIGEPALADSSAASGAGGDGLQTAKGFVDRFGVGEGVHEVGHEQDDVGALLHAVEVFAPDGLGEVERAGFERIGLDGIGFKSGGRVSS